MTGRIIKGIAGFYYVHDGSVLYECKAKGIFRKKHEKPLVGDRVEFDVISDAEKTGNITALLPRDSVLIRPEIANVDQLFLVFAASDPEPNFDMLNRYLCVMSESGIPVSLVVNKTDLSSESDLERIEDAFLSTGYPLYFISVKEGSISVLTDQLKGKVTALAGPSGVGKSSFINLIMGSERAETGELSQKIMRGKNTTRHSEIFYLGDDTYIFDTPGFTFIDIESIETDKLQYTFQEFLPYITECRFASCSHVKEKDCALKQALSEGRISKMRYDCYVRFHEELKALRRY